MTDSERDDFIAQWQEAKKRLTLATNNEMELRKEIVARTFDPKKVKGTENIPLANGWKLKAIKKQNYNLRGTKEEVVAAMTQMSAETQRELVKWSPKLSLTKYKLLDEKDLAAIDKVIVVTDATPTLELVEPKAKK